MDEAGAGAAIARRRIGSIVTELRKKTSYTAKQAGEHIDRSEPTMVRIEGGRSGVRLRKADINGLCDLYGASDELRRELLSLMEATRVQGWFQPFRDVLPPQFDMYLGLEAACETLQIYEVDRLPGLMQTEGFARAIMSLPGPDGRARDAHEVDRRVTARLRRRDVITREPQPPRIEVLLSESVLRRPIGGPAVMTEQLRQVNALGALPNVSVRVVPFSAGLHQGVTVGQFALLRFPSDSAEPPTVFVDGAMGSLWFKEKEEIDRFASAFADIQQHALNNNSSRKLIDQAAKELT